jgi:hypothetical protein
MIRRPRMKTQLGMLMLLVAALVVVDAAGTSWLLSGMSPTCISVGCSGCVASSTRIPARSSMTIKTMSCAASETVLVKSMSFAPMCTTASQCSRVKLDVNTVAGIPDVASGCFQSTAPRLITDANGAAMRTLTISASCEDNVDCAFAALLDVVCREFKVGHSASGMFSCSSSMKGMGMCAFNYR